MPQENVLFLKRLNDPLLEPPFSDLRKICAQKNITTIVINNLTEIMYGHQVESFDAQIADLPHKICVLTHNSSHPSTVYNKIGMEWCAHTGWIWENVSAPRHIAQGIVSDSHNRSYTRRQIDNTRGLMFLGKLRWSSRILFWDAFISENLHSEFYYSYYPLLKHSQVYQHQQESLSEITHRGHELRISPLDWDNYAQIAVDYDLSDQLPESAPDRSNVFYCGYPTDPELYQKTTYSLVPETTSGSETWTPFATEKTYRAIQNYHPYLSVGDLGLNKHMNSELGYENFLEEFDVTDCDLNTDIMSPGLSVSDLGKAIRHAHDTFQGNFEKNFKRIQEKVYFNRQHWQSSAEIYRSKLRVWDHAECWDHNLDPIPNLCDYITHTQGIYLY